MFSPEDCAPNAPSAFSEYVDALRRALQPAIVTPLVDTKAPGDKYDGAFVGRVGAFQAPGTINGPLGQWAPTYMGIVPQSAQVQIKAPEPWEADDGM